jgi:hypothetical protein
LLPLPLSGIHPELETSLFQNGINHPGSYAKSILTPHASIWRRCQGHRGGPLPMVHRVECGFQEGGLSSREQAVVPPTRRSATRLGHSLRSHGAGVFPINPRFPVLILGSSLPSPLGSPVSPPSTPSSPTQEEMLCQSSRRGMGYERTRVFGYFMRCLYFSHTP